MLHLPELFMGKLYLKKYLVFDLIPFLIM